MEDVGSLVTTRLASLCLRRGRPRGLTFDDRLVRAALVVDLAIGGALTDGVASVDPDATRAKELGLDDVAADLTQTGTPLDQWILDGGIGFEHWERRLVEAGVWIPRPRSLLRPFSRYEDGHAERTADDRAIGNHPWPESDYSAQTLAVLAVGTVGRLFGKPDPAFSYEWSGSAEPPPWVMTGMGEAAWAGSLAVQTLGELYVKLRPGAVSLG